MKNKLFKYVWGGVSLICVSVLILGISATHAAAQQSSDDDYEMTDFEKEFEKKFDAFETEDGFDVEGFIKNFDTEDLLDFGGIRDSELSEEIKNLDLNNQELDPFGGQKLVMPEFERRRLPPPRMSMPFGQEEQSADGAFLLPPSPFTFSENCRRSMPRCSIYWFFSYSASRRINRDHCEVRKRVSEHLADEMSDQQQWFTETFVKDLIIPALKQFTEQMVATSVLQTFSIGTFFDAKHQLETQRLFQELQFEAHKDYQPSKGFCTIGTAVRSLAHTDSASRHTSMVLSRRQMARHLGNKSVGGAINAVDDKKIRWQQFISNYCDPHDNNWTTTADTGLKAVCGNVGPGNTDRINIDIDYTRAIENRRTLDNYGPLWAGSDQEFDTLALGNNLYGHDVITRDLSGANIENEGQALDYMELRSIAAKRSVAENSFNAIVGMKSLGSTIDHNVKTVAGVDTHMYLGRILQDLGIPEDEVVDYLGLDSTSAFIDPANADLSHFAQLEILAKKIYQNPTFYAQLYDTPANVQRKSAALKAIELMLDRAIYESQLRQEMAMSVLLSTRLQKSVEEVSTNLGAAN